MALCVPRKTSSMCMGSSLLRGSKPLHAWLQDCKMPPMLTGPSVVYFKVWHDVNVCAAGAALG